MGFDIQASEELRLFLKEYTRLLVFFFLAAQAVCGLFFIWIATQKTNPNLQLPDLATAKLFDIPSPSDWRWYDVISLVFFALILFIYSFLIVDNADLYWHDQSHITSGALLGNLWMQIVPQNGRFSPLLHQEYLLIALFAKESWQYYWLAVFNLWVFSATVFMAMPLRSISLRLLVVGSLVATLGFSIAVSGLIYPEINMVYALLIFIACALKANSKPDGKQRLLPMTGCVLSSLYLIYIKEPLFLVMATYALLSLWLEANKKDLRMKSVSMANVKEICRSTNGAVAIVLLVFSGAYALVYFVYIYLQTQESYTDTYGRGALETLLMAVYYYPFIAVLCAALLFKAKAYKQGLATLIPVWDPMAVGMAVYCAVLVITGMGGATYYLPVAVFSCLYLVRMFRQQMIKPFVVVTAVFVCLLTIANGVPSSLEHFRVRELYMQNGRQVVEMLKAVQWESNDSRRIFFIERNQGFDAIQFASYAGFSGLKLSESDSYGVVPAFGKGVFQLVPVEVSEGFLDTDQLTKLIQKQGLVPSVGDLVVSMPDRGGGTVVLGGRIEQVETTAISNDPTVIGMLSQGLKTVLFKAASHRHSAVFKAYIWNVE